MLHWAQSLLLTAALASSNSQDLNALRAQVERPLVVNGERVDVDLLKRFLVYSAGSTLIEVVTREALLELYDEPNSAAPVPVDDSAFAKVLRRYKGEHGSDQLEAAIHNEFGTRAIAERFIRSQARFDQLFLPINPNHWPQFTLDALQSESEGAVLEDAFETYEDKLASGKPLQPESEVYLDYLREVVELQLREQFTVEAHRHGLPDELVLRVGSRFGPAAITLNLVEAFELILPALDNHTIERERRWLRRLIATEQALGNAGLLLSKTEARELYEQRVAAQPSSFFSLESVAINTDYFPSLEHFRAYARLKDSHDQLFRADDVLIENGQLPKRSLPYLPKANQALGLAKVNVRIMHFTARDPMTNRFSEAGFSEALEAASEASLIVSTNTSGLDADLRSRPTSKLWDELCALCSRPPSFRYPKPNSRRTSGYNECGTSQCGHLGRSCATFHDLQMILKSSYYEDLLEEAPAARWVFLEQPLQSVSPPLRTPEGYAVVWLLDRDEPTHPLRLKEKRHRKLLREFASRSEFDSFWREAARSSRVR